MTVRPKRSLGQHFLVDDNIARKITRSLSTGITNLIEIGPGTGKLTMFLPENRNLDLYLIETDRESVEYLKSAFPEISGKIIHADFLKYDISSLFSGNFSITGNFPYNISSQIFFKILDHREKIDEVVCMVQKEVAERIAAPPGNRQYGILSVLLQAYFDIRYLFTVSESVFLPKPKVRSAVIKLNRNNVIKLDCDEALFFRIVKTAFNYRRKTLRNSLRELVQDRSILENKIFDLRAEQLGVGDFADLTNLLK